MKVLVHLSEIFLFIDFIALKVHDDLEISFLLDLSDDDAFSKMNVK